MGEKGKRGEREGRGVGEKGEVCGRRERCVGEGRGVGEKGEGWGRRERGGREGKEGHYMLCRRLNGMMTLMASHNKRKI